ncbi:MAG TPA: threonine/serine dehydratase [Thermoplasmata archaeon]
MPSEKSITTLKKISIRDIEAARKRLAGLVLRTPVIRLDVEDAPAEIHLKLENLQPTGSFKVRGAGNAISLLTPTDRKRGVYTCSAGNMAQALAWHARRLGIPCTVIVPDTAPQTKLAGIRRFGAEIVQLSWDEVWKIGITRVYEPLKDMVFVHPFSEFGMIAGNGTIGLEILEDLPTVDAVVVPYGGGGLIGGIATAIKARQPRTKVYACEPETAAPLAASFAAGSPQEFKRIPSFVDGSGASSVLPEMWELNRPLLAGSIVVSLREVASAIKLLVERHHVVSEGAGGSSVAAALTGKAGSGRVVAVVSGGNIDPAKLTTILDGRVP